MAQQSNKSLMAQARLTENELIGVLTGMPRPDPAAYLGGIAPIDYAKNVAHAQNLQTLRTVVAWLRERAEEDISLGARVADIARMSTLKSTADALQAQLTAAEQEGK